MILYNLLVLTFYLLCHYEFKLIILLIYLQLHWLQLPCKWGSGSGCYLFLVWRSSFMLYIWFSTLFVIFCFGFPSGMFFSCMFGDFFKQFYIFLLLIFNNYAFLGTIIFNILVHFIILFNFLKKWTILYIEMLIF